MYILTRKKRATSGSFFDAKKRGVNMLFKIFELCIAITLIFTLVIDIVSQFHRSVMKRIDEKIELMMREKSE